MGKRRNWRPSRSGQEISPWKRLSGIEIEKGHTRLILDLIHEKYIDSNDLAQILGTFKRAGESGGELVIANPNSKIREIFRITKLDDVMKLFDSVEAAAQHFASSA